MVKNFSFYFMSYVRDGEWERVRFQTMGRDGMSDES